MKSDPQPAGSLAPLSRDELILSASEQVLGITSEKEAEYERRVSNLQHELLRLFDPTQRSRGSKKYDEGSHFLASDLRRLRKLVWGSYFEAGYSAKTEVLNSVMKLIHECSGAQICAIFFIDKYGLLRRQGFYGVDCNGIEIENEWLANECYEIDDSSFVGRTALANTANESNYGSIQSTYNLEDDLDRLNPHFLDLYKKRIGNSISRAVAAPINNKSGTIGVLRILNHMDAHIESPIPIDDSFFKHRDVLWLSLFSSQINNIVAEYEQVFHRRFFSQIISQCVSKDRPRSDNPGTQTSSFLTKTLQALIKFKDNPFVFAVIRLVDDNQNLVVVASASADDSFSDNRINDSIPRSNSDTFVNIALNTKEPIIIPTITKSLSQFNNKDWIDKNRFTTFSCFPILFQDMPLGTLSLYTVRTFIYDSHCLEYLQTIVDSLATYLHTRMKNQVESFKEHQPVRHARKRARATKNKTHDSSSEWSFRTIVPSARVGTLSPEKIRAVIKDVSSLSHDPE